MNTRAIVTLALCFVGVAVITSCDFQRAPVSSVPIPLPEATLRGRITVPATGDPKTIATQFAGPLCLSISVNAVEGVPIYYVPPSPPIILGQPKPLPPAQKTLMTVKATGDFSTGSCTYAFSPPPLNTEFHIEFTPALARGQACGDGGGKLGVMTTHYLGQYTAELKSNAMELADGSRVTLNFVVDEIVCESFSSLL